jgi:hypothetical protein
MVIRAALIRLEYLDLYAKLSSRLWVHSSGRLACLSGTAETLVGGDSGGTHVSHPKRLVQ